MSFRPLDLGQLQFGCAQSKHQLRVTSSMQTSSIKNIGIAPQNLKLLDALTSREVWATRGDGLQIAFTLLINGKNPDDTAQRTLQIEGLGMVLRNAEVHSSLYS